MGKIDYLTVNEKSMFATLTIDFIGSTWINHSDKYFIVFYLK